MANKTKVTSRNAFTVNLLALQSKKTERNDETTFFRDYLQILDLSLNP